MNEKQASTAFTRMFLSCLYGSEQDINEEQALAEFLSCLYGSELEDEFAISGLPFLSCLYGSELDQNPTNPLIQKAKPVPFALEPSFYLHP